MSQRSRDHIAAVVESLLVFVVSLLVLWVALLPAMSSKGGTSAVIGDDRIALSGPTASRQSVIGSWFDPGSADPERIDRSPLGARSGKVRRDAGTSTLLPPSQADAAHPRPSVAIMKASSRGRGEAIGLIHRDIGIRWSARRGRDQFVPRRPRGCDKAQDAMPRRCARRSGVAESVLVSCF